MHGGRVDAKSEGAGRGSEFIVTLPLSCSTSLAGQEPNPRKYRLKQRIVVVDDNRDAAEMLCTLLGLLGAEVCAAHDGASALDTFRTQRPSVVILDIGMPGMDGYELARRLRHESGSRKVTLIALTGWGQHEDRRRSRAAGIDHHLVKPLELDALERVLAEI